MPYADPERKKEKMKEWRKRKISEGYGQALYARRKARLDNEARMREDIEALLLTVQAAYDKDLGWLEDKIIKILNRSPHVNGKPLDFMPKKEE